MAADLEEYFAQMMSNRDKIYLEQAFHEISLMTYSFLHEEDPDYAIDAPVTPTLRQRSMLEMDPRNAA